MTVTTYTPAVTPFGPVAGTDYRVSLGYYPDADTVSRWNTALWNTTPAKWEGVAPFADVTCDVMSVQLAAGRDSPLERFRPGTATVTLNDPTGIYSPWATVSTDLSDLYGAIRVGINLIVWAIHDGVSYPRFTGVVTDIVDTFPELGAQHQVTFHAADRTALLAQYDGVEQAAAGASELAGARIHRILTNAEYDGDTAFDVGTVALQATTLAKNALDEVGITTDTELGAFWCAPDGVLVFRDRNGLVVDPHYTTVQAVFGDSDPPPVTMYRGESFRIPGGGVVSSGPTVEVPPAGMEFVWQFALRGEPREGDRIHLWTHGGDVAPLAPGDANVVGWWDARTLPNGPVAVWPDQSPHHHDAAQVNATYRPTVGVETVNGQGVVTFNAATPTVLDVGAAGYPAVNTMTLFAVVMKHGAMNLYERIVSMGGVGMPDATSPGAIVPLYAKSTTEWGAYYNSHFGPAGTAAADIPHVLCLRRDGDKADLFIDDTLVGTSTGWGTAPFTFPTIRFGGNVGGGEMFTGSLGQVILTHDAVSESQRIATLRELQATWGSPQASDVQGWHSFLTVAGGQLVITAEWGTVSASSDPFPIPAPGEPMWMSYSVRYNGDLTTSGTGTSHHEWWRTYNDTGGSWVPDGSGDPYPPSDLWTTAGLGSYTAGVISPPLGDATFSLDPDPIPPQPVGLPNKGAGLRLPPGCFTNRPNTAIPVGGVEILFRISLDDWDFGTDYVLLFQHYPQWHLYLIRDGAGHVRIQAGHDINAAGDAWLTYTNSPWFDCPEPGEVVWFWYTMRYNTGTQSHHEFWWAPAGGAYTSSPPNPLWKLLGTTDVAPIARHTDTDAGFALAPAAAQKGYTLYDVQYFDPGWTWLARFNALQNTAAGPGPITGRMPFTDEAGGVWDVYTGSEWDTVTPAEVSGFDAYDVQINTASWAPLGRADARTVSSVDPVTGPVFTDDNGNDWSVASPAVWATNADVIDVTGEEICYTEIVLATGDDKIKNMVSIANVGGTAATVNDTASISLYHPHTYSRTDLIHVDPAQSPIIATRHLDFYAYAANRIDALTVDVTTVPAEHLPALLALDTLHRIEVRRRPVGFQVVAELQIEGIAEQVTPDSWTMTFRTFSADAVFDVGKWDTDRWGHGLWGY